MVTRLKHAVPRCLIARRFIGSTTLRSVGMMFSSSGELTRRTEMRDDLPRLLDQFTHDLTGRLDLAGQANTLPRQQINRIDIAAGFSIRRQPHEAPPRHGPTAADRPAADRLLP